MSACPDDAEMLQLIEGQLSPAHRARLDAHIDGCAACAEWIAAMAEVLAPDLAADQSPAPRPDETLIDDRYLVRDLLGAGAMGVVYVAEDQRLSRQVALKLMRPDILEPELRAQVQERMRREAQALAALAHPNVVSVHDVGHWEERVFIAMEYVRGAAMSAWADSRRSWRDLLDAWLQACDGLAAAHDAGLVHRDIKPDNLLIGADGRVRLTDFGLAGAFEDLHPPRDPDRPTARGVWATRTGLLIGTPAYMSPEQLSGQRATARSDQFSLCVALYETLYDARPFAGDTLPALRTAIADGPTPPPPPTTHDAPPPALYLAIARGLRDDPADRYPSIADLKAHLIRAADQPPPRRPTLAIAFVTVATLALSAAGGLALSTLPDEDAPQTAPDAPSASATTPGHTTASTASPPPQATTAPPAGSDPQAILAAVAEAEQAGRVLGEIGQAIQRRDGVRCLVLIKDNEELLARHPSTAATIASQHAACLMLLGRCDEGRRLYERSYREQLRASQVEFPEATIQSVIDAHLKEFCVLPDAPLGQGE